MTDDSHGHGMTRRGVLRRGAVAAGAVTVGVSGFSGSALGSFCPRSHGYWANHDWCELLVDPDATTPVWECLADDGDCPEREGTYTLAGDERTLMMWKAFLTDPDRGDKAAIMGKAVLATALNFCRLPPRPDGCDSASDCDQDGSCAYEKLDLSEYGIETEMNVAEVKNTAFEWLRASNWGTDDEQRSWTVELDDGTTLDGEPYKDALDAFNNGELNPEDCFCEGTDE